MQKNPAFVRSPRFIRRMLLALALFGSSQPALAQAPSTAVPSNQPGQILPVAPPSGCQETPEAEKLFTTGKELLSLNLNREALVAFQRSHAQSRCMRSLAQIAFAERALRRWADASSHLNQALESTDPWIEEHRAQFQDELATINEYLRRAEGRNEDPELAERSAPKTPKRTKAGWGLLVSGALLGGFAGGFLALREAYRKPFEEATSAADWTKPGTADWTKSPWQSAIARGEDARTAGIVLAAVGGVAAVGGIILIAWPQEKTQQKQTQLNVFPSGNGMVLSGRY